VRESICVIVDDSASVQAAEEWLASHRHRLDYISENYGCGCCVDLYDLEGTEDVLSTIPHDLRCSSEWTRDERATRRPAAE
jgi:hypothetical protein